VVFHEIHVHDRRLRACTELGMTRPLSTAIPYKAMKPIAAEIENGIPRRINAITPPTRARLAAK
jgi:hypothetical protein